MTSITAVKHGTKNVRIRLWAVLVWLAIWELAAQLIGQEILLVSPVSVLKQLTVLSKDMEFWQSILFSLIRITGGFLLSFAAGILLAGFGAACRPVRELLAPFMAAVKAVPVASFTILVLIWVPSRNLSVVISFLMVLPVIYTNMLDGIRSTDPGLLEMADVFRISVPKRIRYIYASQVLPYLRAGLTISLGMCWKAGIAAEVIGIPKGSIGEKLYEAKVYLETPDLFAWTVVIVIVSILFEKIFLLLTEYIITCLERM